MIRSIKESVFEQSFRNLKIKSSELENAGLLGAAALCYDSTKLF